MAKLAGKEKITKKVMRQDINIKRYLKRDATIEDKIAFIEKAVERINNRTLDHETIHGGRFKKYSKEYAAKKGVSRESVDLFLEGDLLNSVGGTYKEGDNKVRIEIQNKDEVPKGYNHHKGDTLPKRPWFGITTDEANQIAKEINEETREQREARKETTLAELLSAIRLVDNDR